MTSVGGPGCPPKGAERAQPRPAVPVAPTEPAEPSEPRQLPEPSETGSRRGPGRKTRSAPRDLRPRAKLWPGEPGTKRFREQYGDRLVCVRYLYDANRRRRVTTVELVVDEGVWAPRPRRPAPDPVVGIRTDWDDRDVESRVAAAGGVWDRKLRLWRLPQSRARALGVPDLHRRLVALPDRVPARLSPRR